MFGGVGATQFDHLHDLIGHQFQERPLLLVQLARLVVEHADRPQRKALGRRQQGARIEAQMRIAENEWIVAEAIVERGVRDLEQAGLQNGVRADRTVQRRLADPKPDFGLEPLPATVDQINDRNRRLANRRRDFDDLVEIGFPGRVEDAVTPQSGKAVLLGTMQVCLHGLTFHLAFVGYRALPPRRCPQISGFGLEPARDGLHSVCASAVTANKPG